MKLQKFTMEGSGRLSKGTMGVSAEGLFSVLGQGPKGRDGGGAVASEVFSRHARLSLGMQWDYQVLNILISPGEAVQAVFEGVLL